MKSYLFKTKNIRHWMDQSRVIWPSGRSFEEVNLEPYIEVIANNVRAALEIVKLTIRSSELTDPWGDRAILPVYAIKIRPDATETCQLVTISEWQTIGDGLILYEIRDFNDDTLIAKHLREAP